MQDTTEFDDLERARLAQHLAPTCQHKQRKRDPVVVIQRRGRHAWAAVIQNHKGVEKYFADSEDAARDRGQTMLRLQRLAQRTAA